jgi:hypothetical protein
LFVFYCSINFGRLFALALCLHHPPGYSLEARSAACLLLIVEFDFLIRSHALVKCVSTLSRFRCVDMSPGWDMCGLVPAMWSGMKDSSGKHRRTMERKIYDRMELDECAGEKKGSDMPAGEGAPRTIPERRRDQGGDERQCRAFQQ